MEQLFLKFCHKLPTNALTAIWIGLGALYDWIEYAAFVALIGVLWESAFSNTLIALRSPTVHLIGFSVCVLFRSMYAHRSWYMPHRPLRSAHS